MGKLRPSLTEEHNRKRRAVIESYFAERGYTRHNGMVTVMGLSSGTATNRYKDPTTITIGELRRLKGLTDEQILRLVKG